MREQDTWERDVLEKLAFASLDEQRRARRWKNGFRLLWLALAGTVAFKLFWHEEERNLTQASAPHTAVIRLDGTIDSQSDTAEKMIQALNDAYGDSGTRGIIVHANSPGGSPVLSGRVNDEIRRLRKAHPSIPVHVVVEEVCASGCYYIAAAADNIYVDKASVIGSIGVLSDGFGFTGLMEKLGIERRLRTAGTDKGGGDPFSPETPRSLALRQSMLDGIHRQFIATVKQGRGKRLKDVPDLFTGRAWLGDEAITVGLADGLGSVDSVARDVLHAPDLVDYTVTDDVGSRVARYFGVEMAGAVRSAFGNRFY